MIKRRAMLLAVLMMGGQMACAEIGVTAKIGFPLGPGGELTVGLSDSFNVRVGYNFMDFTFDMPFTEEDVEAGIDWSSFTAFLDWHPGGSDWRVTVGVIAPDTLTIASSPDDAITIGSLEYDVDYVSGSAEVAEVAPYLGLGYGNAGRSRGLHFSFDAGVAWLGGEDPNVELAAVARPVGLGGLPDELLQAQLAKDLQVEEEELEDELAELKIAVIVAFGISYTF
jgi:hypothetical protein